MLCKKIIYEDKNWKIVWNGKDLEQIDGAMGWCVFFEKNLKLFKFSKKLNYEKIKREEKNRYKKLFMIFIDFIKFWKCKLKKTRQKRRKLSNIFFKVLKNMKITLKAQKSSL
jgi:hypothetical protein